MTKTDNKCFIRKSQKSILTKAGFWLSALVSFALTIEFFRSLSTSILTLTFFVAIAVIFELLKLQTLQVLPKCFSKRRAFSGIVCITVYCCLALLSFFASVGSMSSSISVQKAQIERVGEHNSELRLRINSIQKEITQNNESIQTYQKMQMIQLRVLPLQKKNVILRAQLQTLQKQIQPMPSVSAIESVVESIQNAFHASYETACLLLFSLLSFLLELACAVFIMLSFVESDSRERLTESVSEDEKSISSIRNIYDTNGVNAAMAVNTTCIQKPEPEKIEARSTGPIIKKEANSDTSKLAYNKDSVIKFVRTRKGHISKRMILRRYEIGARKLNDLFEELIEKKIIAQKSTGRYYVVRVA